MEYFDILDKNRNYLNYVKTRGEKLKEDEYNQGAEIWIINHKKLLITKRSLNKSHPGEWETPGGCSVTGESTIDTILRETNEEINLSLTKNDITFLATQLYKKQFVDIFKTKKQVNLLNIKLQLDEVCDIKFVSKDEFYKMIERNEIVHSVVDRYNLIKNILDKDW